METVVYGELALVPFHRFDFNSKCSTFITILCFEFILEISTLFSSFRLSSRKLFSPSKMALIRFSTFSLNFSLFFFFSFLIRSAHTQVPHEWPQTKKASNKHNFPPVQKPPQTYSTEGWYVGVCNRIDAEHALHLVNKDGAFLVRDSTINTIAEPLVLAVYHDKKVYNVKIRYIERTCTFALGKGRGPNVMFHSVEEMIRFHTISPLPLTNGRYATGSKNCVLTYPVTKGDVDKLLQ
uniref:SH2 domain-containing protein n=1 Tax=Gouania willdenowi TaxID=441366 RepID=A0A8C5HDM1_GOUWI